MSFSVVLERLKNLENPYPGLRPFETSEAHLFYGRDPQIIALAANLERHRFVAVVGLSGSGKSSLVRAGLIPTLQRRNQWRVHVMRPRGAPYRELANTLGGDEPGFRKNSFGLIDFVGARPEPVLLVVDQFEELFRYHDQRSLTDAERRNASADASEFTQLLLTTVREPGRVSIVITMRSEYLGECAEFRDLPEALNESQYLVPRLSREQRREAIEGPLGRVRISPALVERILNDAGDEPDQLPVLQHALMRTWSRWRASSTEDERYIDIEDYVATEGFVGALNQHANELLNSPAARVEPGMVDIIFKRLTALRRGRERRDPAPLSELWALCNAESEEQRLRVNALIDVFRTGEATFLTPHDGPLKPDTYIDITHESLIRKWEILAAKWLADEKTQAKTLIELLDRARGWKEGNREVLRGLDLAAALEWDSRRNRSTQWAEHYTGDAGSIGHVEAFLAASRQELENSERQQREQREREVAEVQKAFVLDLGPQAQGLERPETLTLMSNLAETLRAQGDLVGACTLQEQVLYIRRGLLGAEHADTLASMSNLADTQRARGDLEEARKLQEQVLGIRLRVLGPEHPDTFTSMINLAGTVRGQGDLAGARNLEKEILDIRLRVLGPEHPDTLRAMFSLADVLSAERDYAAARPLLDQLVTASTLVLGKQDPLTSGAAWLLYESFKQGDTAARSVLEGQLLWLLERDPATLPEVQQHMRLSILEMFRGRLAAWVEKELKNERSRREEGRPLMDVANVTQSTIEAQPFALSSGPLLTVGAEDADFRSIAEAIRAAAAGSRIAVTGPAEYRESLRIEKPLEIAGDGHVTVVGVGGPAITCTGAAVRIARLKITAEGFNGVIISGGFCVLEDAEVSGTRYSGVLVRDAAEAAIIRCSLHHAEHSGIHAQLGSKCTVVGSAVRENGVGGLFFSQDAGGLVEGNVIEGNRHNGIFVAAGANPRISHNRIARHGNAGVLVYQHDEWRDVYGPGRGTIADNEIIDGDQFAIQIEDGADPCVQGNVIRANKWGGIWTRKRGRGTIFGNRLIDNLGSGIKNEGGHPLIGQNVIDGNRGQPVQDHGGATQDDKYTCQRLKKVLWVDDNPANNDEIVDHYRPRGVSFDLATSTKQALDFLAEGNYALILSDIGRGTDWDAGVRMISEIRTRFPAAAPIIIYAHPGAVEAHGERALNLGASLVTASREQMMRKIEDALV